MVVEYTRSARDGSSVRINLEVRKPTPRESVREHALTLLGDATDDGGIVPTDDLRFQHIVSAKDFLAPDFFQTQPSECELGIYLLLAEVTAALITNTKNAGDAALPVPLLRSDACRHTIGMSAAHLLACLLTLLCELRGQFELRTGAEGEFVFVYVASNASLETPFGRIRQLIPDETGVKLQLENNSLKMLLPK
ncbi:hypothetical protein [Roseiconus lacunae]|uniref:hypothetical protein n=1 Tax=Roseiconus lacunae TaxID=2605694 RepID=UPI001E6075E2|nr:hypothetical protein [Roseiconus lacunae]MCD0462379.1 hypothetical protein [Roseiconus lacunae]